LDALQTKGYVTRTPNVSRGLRVLTSQPGLLASPTVSLSYIADAFDRHPASLRKVSDGTLHLDASLLAGRSAADVVVIAAGDDGMTGEGIRKGDRVVTHLLAATDMKSEGLAVVVLHEQLVVRFLQFTRREWHVKPSARHYSEETFPHGDSALYPIGRVLSIVRIVAENEASPLRVSRR
jgi:repressor LexA